jgi:NAD(P)-dependent dehydrogenase (short-subunit alcohol dehydrogenase family)
MKTILITGATSGIGKDLINILANKNYNLLFIGRNKRKCEDLKNFLENTKKIKTNYYISDFNDLNSVKKMTEKIISNNQKIDALINNAGKVYFSYKKSLDGIEKSFQINYLSHFLLTSLLVKNNLFTKNSQIINVSSVAHNPNSSINSLDKIKNKEFIGKINFQDINYKNNKFKGFSSLFYSRSKMAQILWTYYLSDIQKNISINAIHPGLLGSNVIYENGFLGKIITPFFKLFFKSTAEGAKSIINLLDLVFEQNLTGKYFDEKIESKSYSYTYNKIHQKKLYEESHKLLEKFIKI